MLQTGNVYANHISIRTAMLFLKISSDILKDIIC